MNNELFPSDDYSPRLSLDQGRENSPASPPPPTDPYLDHRKRIRGLPWLAWIIVIGLTVFVMSSHFFAEPPEPDAEFAKSELLQAVYVGKIAVGITELSPQPMSPSDARQMLQGIDVGPIEQRFCYLILTNELLGPEKALDELANLKTKVAAADLTFNENQKREADILENIFNSSEEDKAAQVSEADRIFLQEKLPWYGELALNTKISNSEQRKAIFQRAQTSTIMLFSLLALFTGMFLVGVVLFFIYLAKALGGRLKYRVVDDSRYGGVYIETYAIWFSLFLAISVAVVASGTKGLSLGTTTLMMLLPLSALIWPILRGVAFTEMLDDLGLRLRNPFVEIMAGITAYLAMLPVMLIGVLGSVIVFFLMSLLTPAPTVGEFGPNGVSHPIVENAFGANPLQTILTIFFIASVLAPLTEEIMFRGVLYRTLRDGSRRSSRMASVAFAAFTSSLIFAAIHPQGLIGIPILTVLACGFCLVRQWRGSLVAPMTMHAIHNGMTMSLLIPMMI
ncbi:MAG: CPBP family intramembrane metalloprotease [Planctomycetaceae bacterium]|nr:CPBP family intramembrane metalloprotease [Planctomycetaceae bacterium]